MSQNKQSNLIFHTLIRSTAPQEIILSTDHQDLEQIIAMLLDILMQYVFVGTCYVLSIVISCGTFKTGLFSFYGWQDHLNFSSEQRTAIYGASDFEATPIFCAINCAQNRTCIMFYICRYLSNLNMFILKVITNSIYKRS